ncbi:short-chain fatty acyl-CoA regulator family protein [Gordonia hydrophobica]|uniref:short-chain fatty acyl-CoA regulator family protein n=1 Tax=Gordonia hydrophobica TaxID=40516 RepID=UPI0035587A8D
MQQTNGNERPESIREESVSDHRAPAAGDHRDFDLPADFFAGPGDAAARELCLARTVGGRSAGYLSTPSDFSIGLGCDLAHADELVYATARSAPSPCWATASRSTSGSATRCPTARRADANAEWRGIGGLRSLS